MGTSKKNHNLQYNKEFERISNQMISEKVSEGGTKELLKRIGGDDYIYNISTGLANFIFRQGPIEDMHSGNVSYRDNNEGIEPELISQLSDEDMKTLNKYMVDKLGFFLKLIEEGRFLELSYLIQINRMFVSGWDRPNLEEEEKEWEEIWNGVLGRINFDDVFNSGK